MLPKAALWDSERDEAVEVDQRGLIDKILARYPGEFTVFRELLQNSDDAKSLGVEIRFETKDYLDEQKVASSEEILNPEKTTIHQWTFKNNGNIFREEDWRRLKNIGEGNPDEEKIGAFGVGFYSLFSVTEKPLVTSGDKRMMFHWKDGKNQLFAQSGSFNGRGDQSHLQWTTFSMPLRDPRPIPSVFDLAQFLASSITFMKYLAEVNIYFNDHKLVVVKKTIEKPNPVISEGYMSHSPQKMMEVTSIGVSTVKIEANVMNSVYCSQPTRNLRPVSSPSKPSKLTFSSLRNLTRRSGSPRGTKTPPPESSPVMGISHADISLSIFSATVKVKLTKKMIDELERSTKKKPPPKLKFELIYTPKNQYDSSFGKEGKVDGAGSIFQGLRADLNKSGNAKVFIGHSTSQSTGIGGHISARLIPTVERECIDFMNPDVAAWNREMLYVGGILARAACDHELKKLQQRWDAHPPSTRHSDEHRSRFVCDALHILKFFDFYDSQPSKEVSAQLYKAFFGCSASRNLRMVSNIGVKMSGDIRLPNAHLTDTLRDVPMLPVEVMEADLFIIERLQKEGIFREITFQDVIPELQSRALTEVACAACFNWWISTQYGQLFSSDKLTQFLSAVRIALSDQDDLPLNSVQYFFNHDSPTVGSIPVDGPLPRSLLPLSISACFRLGEIPAHFPWAEFNWQAWLTHVCDMEHEMYNICFSTPSERVINAVSCAWDRLPEEAKSEIKNILHDRTCIPTRKGMKKPSEAYFSSADVLPDLSIIEFSSYVLHREAFLQYLGVRRHVDLQVILHRMGDADEWPVTKLVAYLASTEGITQEEITHLQDIPAFPKEMIPGGEACTNGPKYMARQLYPPAEEFRIMELPILDWGQKKWWNESDEATFLYKIGLQRHPSIQQLNELCGSRDEKVRVASFQYLLEHLDKEYPLDDIAAQLGCIIPAFNGPECCLARVEEVCSNQDWATMGLLVLQPKYKPYADKLKIREHPTSRTLVSILQDKPPRSKSEAARWFSLLSTALNVFSKSDLEHLSTISFIPITPDEEKNPPKWQSPSCCFLGGNVKDTFYTRIFTYVDFGAGANAFLTACGSNNQPSIEDVATKLLEKPHHFYTVSGSPSNYLDELRKFALERKNLMPDTFQRMKDSPILLGMKKNSGNVVSNSSHEWEEEGVTYQLAKPQEIAIVDDMNTYRAFSGVAVVAPQDDMLEAFYHSLGCRKLSTHIKENHRSRGIIENSEVGREIRALILERLPLFLHEHKHKAMKDTLSGDNFYVETYDALQVRKHLTLGSADEEMVHDVSALSFKDPTSGRIVLCVTPDVKDGMFEVASSLNRLLFDFPKTNDALLFMTILQSDLKLLKQLGYNVDRILGRIQRGQEETILRPPPESNIFSGEMEKMSGIQGFQLQTQWPSLDWENHFSEYLLPALYGFNPENFDLLESSANDRDLGIDGYCDFSGGNDALHYIDTLDSVQIFLSDKSPHKKMGEFMYNKRDKIKRFINLIIHPLERIFGLSNSKLHIFYDVERPLTAINRDKTIYLNLRYFEEWHSHGLNKEKLKEAYFMWYFTIAHVLTHNAVRPHGAQHDRVFSSICQRFMSNLLELEGC